MNPEKETTITLIEYREGADNLFGHIIDAINHYLLRNKGAVSDFNLIKDIVDRNVDKEEDEISSNLPIPLYLGLIGTLLGIIIGLLGMPTLSGELADGTMEGVNILLSGVQIAMIASVTGLIFTTINSFRFYSIRRKTENKKNQFFTFMQTRLLPMLSKNTTTSLMTLQANLLKFNEGFSSNMDRFNNIISEVGKAFEVQLEVVEELKRIDVAGIAGYNIEVMGRIEASFDNLKQLSEYLNGVKSFLDQTAILNSSVSKQLDMVGGISDKVKRFDENTEVIVQNSKYLNDLFERVDDREQMINNKLADFDGAIDQLLVNLQDSFQKRLQQFNEVDVDIHTGFGDLFDGIKEGFSKLFDDLKEYSVNVFEDEGQNITEISRNVNDLKDQVTELSTLSEEVTLLKSAIEKQQNILDQQHKTIVSQNMNIDRMIGVLTDKPLVFKIPMFLKVIFFFMSAVLFSAILVYLLSHFNIRFFNG